MIIDNASVHVTAVPWRVGGGVGGDVLSSYRRLRPNFCFHLRQAQQVGIQVKSKFTLLAVRYLKVTGRFVFSYKALNSETTRL